MTSGTPPRLAIVDHGAGNLVSIEQALREVGAEVVVVADGAGLSDADAIVVPGVGAAAPAMATLRRAGLVEPIREWIAAGRPYLGICLGLQLLFEGSDEDNAETLGVVAGRVRRLEDAPTLPHTGWNDVERVRPHAVFDGIEPGAPFFFVHSYAGRPEGEDGDIGLATTTHGDRFVSAIAREQLVGVQFHPERSGRDGLRLLANFRALVVAARDRLAVPA